MAPRKRCPVCGSRKWHKEPSSGLITCSEGHVLQNYRNETSEATELGPHSMRKRTIKSTRKRKEKASKADPLLYHGPRARFHYFQCLQLLLRKQIVCLTNLWGLPAEFETVSRDIWALHLSHLPSPPPAEPYYYAQEQQTENPKQTQEPYLQTPRQTQTPAGEESATDEESQESSTDDSSSSPSEPSDNEDEGDPELAALMRDLSESSSAEEDADVLRNPDQNQITGRKKGKQRQYGKYDAPASNIAVLVLACCEMRLPVVYMDFVRVIESYELPYLDPVQRHVLPSSMTRHLTKHSTQALSPHHAPNVLALHRLVSRLAKLMQSSDGIWTPELNAAPVLWRAVRALHGTPTLYVLTKNIAHTLSLPLTLHHSLAPKLEKARNSDPENYHKFDNVPPEVALVAAVVVVLRMVYGLDGRVRLPREKADPACALPKLKEYLAALQKLNEVEAKGKDVLFSVESHLDVTDLADDMLDEYMDFCQRALLGADDAMEDGILGDYFPIRQDIPTQQVLAGQMQTSQFSLTAMHQGANESDLQPAECYRIFNARDVFGALPDEYELVVNRAARWAGVSEECMCAVVERFERRIVRWWDNVRRGEKRKSRDEDNNG